MNRAAAAGLVITVLAACYGASLAMNSGQQANANPRSASSDERQIGRAHV